MDIIQIRNSNAFPGRYGLKPRWVICHGTAGGTSAQAIATYFQGTQGGSNPVSAHYVIGQDGQIVQCNDEGDGAWANGVVTAGHDPWWSDGDNPNPNNVTISIEHVKPDDANASALTPAQQASSFALIADICKRNGIPARAADASGGVAGHYSIDPVNRARCPGNYPWQGLFAYLNSGQQTQEEPMSIDLSTPGVSNYFVAAPGGAWHCPSTNATIGGAILAFYKSFGNSSLNGLTWLGLPLTSELGNIPGKPGVVFQRFERAVLAYDPNHVLDKPPGVNGPVYLMHIDSGLGEDPRVTDLQGHVDALTAQVASLQSSALATQVTALEAKIAQAVKDLS